MRTIMKQLVHYGVNRTFLLVTISAAQLHAASAQEEIRRLPPTRIAVDEDILAAFVDEPCRNFEDAREAVSRGENKRAAHYLRVAAAFLRLEATRATAEGSLMLDMSIRELQHLALSIDNNQIPELAVLKPAFARAHYALAGHHCIKSAHHCCPPAAFENKAAMNRVGHDLNAAATHLNRGAIWVDREPDDETLDVLNAAEFSAQRLIKSGQAPQGEVARAIRSVRDKLEDFTGRKILLAPPMAGYDQFVPSTLR